MTAMLVPRELLWPTIGLSLALFGVAFALRRPLLGWLGVAAAVPFLWYTSHAPNGEWFAPALLGLLIAAIFLLRKGRLRWALVCFVPYGLVVCELLLLLAIQSVRHRPS